MERPPTARSEALPIASRACARTRPTLYALAYRHACPASHVLATNESGPLAAPDMSTHRTAAGGKMALLALYHMSRQPAAAPCAAAGDTTPESIEKTAALTLAQPIVPEMKPLGEGGMAGEKKMMPEAIIGGTKSLLPTMGSSAPISANAPARPAPASSVSTTFSSFGRPKVSDEATANKWGWRRWGFTAISPRGDFTTARDGRDGDEHCCGSADAPSSSSATGAAPQRQKVGMMSARSVHVGDFSYFRSRVVG